MSSRQPDASVQDPIPLDWGMDDGMLSVRPPGNRPFAMQGLSGSITINGQAISLRDATRMSRQERPGANGERTTSVTFLFTEPEVTWVWDLADRITSAGPVLAVTAQLRNTGHSDLILENWNVLHLQREKGGRLDLGRNPSNVRFFGWRPWNTRVERISGEESRHHSRNLCHLYDPGSGTTFLSGFVTIDRMTVNHSLGHVQGRGVAEYRATCTFGEYRLAAGKELASEVLHISYHDNPYTALEGWADQINGTYNPSFEGTLDISWQGGTWIDAFTGKEESWAKILLENAHAIREKLRGFDIRYVAGGTHKILKGGLPGNWLAFEDTPDGEDDYRTLFAKLQAMGFGLKLWFSPFWFYGEAEGILEENRENLLKDQDGNPITAKSSWEFDRNRDPDDTPYLTKYYLDGTHPKTREYLSKIFRAYREMGARAYMLDFLSIQPGAKLYDDTLLPVEAGRQILKVIREAAEADTHLQTAVASTPGFVGCINAARVGRDYGEGRPMYPFHAWRNATHVVHDHHFGNTHSFVQNAAASWFTHRKVYVNDLNQCAVDKPVPLENARITITMFGLTGGSPMALGDDFRTIDPERLRMLKLCLPRTEGVPVPVDLFDRIHPEDYCRVLKLAVDAPWDSYVLAAVFNMDDAPYCLDLEFGELGLDTAAAHRVFDFWNEEYTGTYRGSCARTIPPNSCRLYRIAEARPHPWLLSTDMHIQQGAVEVESIQWNEETKTLIGTVARPAGERGNLFFLIPRHLKLINHEKANTMREVLDMQTVVRWPVEFNGERETFELRFELIDTTFVARKHWLPYATEKEWLDYVEKHRDPNSTRVIE